MTAEVAADLRGPSETERLDPDGAAPLPIPRWPDQLISASTAAAWAALALVTVGVVVGLVPVQNPKVQDCGAPIAFVLRGRIDQYADPSKPPNGLTSAEATAANKDRCQARVARRMVPGGVLILSGLVVGIVGLAAMFFGRSARRRAVLDALPLQPPEPTRR